MTDFADEWDATVVQGHPQRLADMLEKQLESRFDVWLALHPANARLLPYALYLTLLIPVGYVRESHVGLYPLFYTMQCGIIAWLLWRGRRWTPELTLSFHWLAVPVGLLVCVLWIAMGWWMAGEWQPRLDALRQGMWLGEVASPSSSAVHDPHYLESLEATRPGMYYLTLCLRLIGMALIVPLFEELFVRSFLLRAFHRWRESALGVLQFAEDLPILGDWLIRRGWTDHVTHLPGIFREQFERTPLGMLGVCGVVVSTIIFTLAHVPRDWPGAVMCSLLFCALLWATRHKGLGPVIWAHGITNAALLAYSVLTHDWQFV